MAAQPLSHENLLLLVDDLLELEVLELIPKDTDSATMYIPYMMNDAVEYYLILSNCQVMGEIPEEFDGDTLVKLIDSPDRPGLIFEMPSGDKLTLWFDSCAFEKSFYQYHRICHIWRRGEEHWRMLVYMVGTIHDKYAFLGPDSVNDAEFALLPLVHFGPFRFYSPIDEPLDDRYPENEDGWTCMRNLALEAGDTDYVKMIDRANALKKLPFIRTDTLIKNLANALSLSRRKPLFEHIYSKVCEASSRYPERTYSPETIFEMEKARKATDAGLRAEGFTGEYPAYTKGGMSAIVFEEHPFTVQELDYEGFAFRIKAIIWDPEDACPKIRTFH
jgi:hypothetical protein